MKRRIEMTLKFIADRLAEQSTWQGLGFVAGLFFAKARGLDWGQAAGLGGCLSAGLKIIFPDPKP